MSCLPDISVSDKWPSYIGGSPDFPDDARTRRPSRNARASACVYFPLHGAVEPAPEIGKTERDPARHGGKEGRGGIINKCSAILMPPPSGLLHCSMLPCLARCGGWRQAGSRRKTLFRRTGHAACRTVADPRPRGGVPAGRPGELRPRRRAARGLHGLLPAAAGRARHLRAAAGPGRGRHLGLRDVAALRRELTLLRRRWRRPPASSAWR